MSKVEWKKIGDVCKVFTGGEVPEDTIKGQMVPSIERPFPVYTNGKEVYGFSSSYQIDDNAVCISSIGANTGAVFYKKGKFTPAIRLKVLIPQKGVNTRYLYYVTSIIDFRGKNTGSVPNINADYVKNKSIPVVSESAQLQIVEKLDTFTSSIENLKEQIAQRRKQYEYYRDQLLDLEGKEGVEMKPLGEIGEFIRGNGIQKNDFVDEGFGCVHYGQIHARYGFSATETISKIEEHLYNKCKKAHKGDVVLATTSEDAEGVAKPFVWLGNDQVAVSGDAFIYHHNQVGKFMGHQFLTHRFMQFKVKYATGAKVVRISGDNMAKYVVALPSLIEQQRIVDVLDKFEASIQNMETQLSLREKQYEYYRNKLLAFE